MHEAKQDTGFFYRTFDGAGQLVRTLRAHPVWGAVLGLLIFVIAYAGNKALDWVHDALVGPDEFLTQIAEDQRKEFENLKGSLAKLGASLTSTDQATFQAVTTAVKTVEASNQSLVQQLMLAKEENNTLRRLSAKDSGISGGYDFILSSGQALRLDKTNAFGFLSYNGGAAGTIEISLSTKDSSTRHYLSPGESIPYTASDGGNCRLVLLNAEPRDGGYVASLTRMCSD